MLLGLRPEQWAELKGEAAAIAARTGQLADAAGLVRESIDLRKKVLDRARVAAARAEKAAADLSVAEVTEASMERALAHVIAVAQVSAAWELLKDFLPQDEAGRLAEAVIRAQRPMNEAAAVLGGKK